MPAQVARNTSGIYWDTVYYMYPCFTKLTGSVRFRVNIYHRCWTQSGWSPFSAELVVNLMPGAILTRQTKVRKKLSGSVAVCSHCTSTFHGNKSTLHSVHYAGLVPRWIATFEVGLKTKKLWHHTYWSDARYKPFSGGHGWMTENLLPVALYTRCSRKLQWHAVADDLSRDNLSALLSMVLGADSNSSKYHWNCPGCYFSWSWTEINEYIE